MQTRHRSWLPISVAAAVPLVLFLCVAASVASRDVPASVAVESVGIARGTGCAVVHIATSAPTSVEIDRGSEDRVVARFMDAVLAPNAGSIVARTPALSTVLSLKQDTSTPPVVEVEVASSRGQPAEVERFADGRGLIVRLYVDTSRPPARPDPLTGHGRLALMSATTALPGRHAASPTFAPLIAPVGEVSIGASLQLARLDRLTGHGRLALISATAALPGRYAASPGFAPLTAPVGKEGIGAGSPPADALTSISPDDLPRATLARIASLSAEPDTLLAGLPRRSLGALKQTPAALGALATFAPTSYVEARTPLQFAGLTATLTARPAPMPSTAPIPSLQKGAVVERVRVVAHDPLRVAIDCSVPTAHRVTKLATPRGFGITFPDATVGPTCERMVALHPASETSVETIDTRHGAMVVIPSRDGMKCETHAGTSAGTIVVDLVPDGELVAQRPDPADAAGAPAMPDQETLIALHFQDAPIVEILTALAQFAEMNIITTEAVAGTASVHIDDVTLTEAFNIITRLNGLEYTLLGSRNFVVGSPEEIKLVSAVGEDGMPLEFIYKPERTTPQKIVSELREITESLNIQTRVIEDAGSVVFTGLPDRQTASRLQEYAKQVDVPPTDVTRWLALEYATPATIKSALADMLPDVQILLPGDGQQISLVGLAGKSTDVDEAEMLVQSIDVDTSAIPVVADGPDVSDTIQISYIDPEKAVEVLTTMYADQAEVQLLSGPDGLREIAGTMDVGGLRPTATLLVRGPQSVVDDVKALIVKMDVAPPQVEITATITDIRIDKDDDTGFKWDLPGLIISEQNTAGDGFKVGKLVRAPFNSSGAGAFNSTFDAQSVESKTTVLAKTTLVAINGKAANFLVGDIIPYEVTVAGDGTISSSVEFEEIGLGLDFAPSVDRDGLITVFLSPSVRSFSGFSPNGYPIVATREADTIVRVRDGDTIVIGGLLRDEELKTLTGIPFLKDIPFFGNLFKHRQHQKRKSEVVVFAEVRLLQPGDRDPGEPFIAAAGQ